MFMGEQMFNAVTPIIIEALHSDVVQSEKREAEQGCQILFLTKQMLPNVYV